MDMLRGFKNVAISLVLSASLANADSSYIGYQGIAFDDGSAIASTNISLRFTVYQNDGITLVYQETKNSIATTDKGFFSHKIGSGTKTASSPLWSAVNWNDDYKLKVEIDKNNGTTYTDLGTQDLISVGYAKKAETASTLANLTSTVNELNKLDGYTGTATELNYLTSVGSNIQTQLDGKMEKGFTNNPPSNLQVALVKTDGELTYHTGVESTELGYLNGVSSNIQDQLDSKAPKSFKGFSSNPSSYRAAIITSSGTVSYLSAITNTELGYLNNVSSNIQTQLDDKMEKGFTNNPPSNLQVALVKTDGELTYHTGVESTELGYLNGVSSNIQDQLNDKLSTSGNAATATKLATARTINGKSFDGSANITADPYIERDDSTNTSRYLSFVDNSTAGYKRLNMDTNLKYNPYSNILYASTFSGNATSATKLQTSRTIGGVSFDGSANINLPGVNIAGTQDTSGNAATATTLTNLTASVSELNKIDGYTGSSTELNYLDTLHAKGVTATEFDYLDGVTSNIQTQLDNKLSTSGGTVTSDIDMGGQDYIRYSGDTTDYFGWYSDDSYYVNIDSVKIISAYRAGVAINQDGKSDVDFRVESDTKSAMLFVDAENNKIGIGKAYSSSSSGNLSYTLDVSGTLGVSGQITANSIDIGGATTSGISSSISSSSSSNLATEGAVKSYVDNQTSGIGIPAGSIMPFAGSSAPSGWLLCDGSAYSTSTYSTLYGVVGYTYGSSGSYFRVPDLRNRGIMGKGTDSRFNTLGEIGGASTHTLTVNEIPPHNHTFSSSTGNESGDGSTRPVSGSKTSELHSGPSLGMQNTGGGQAHNILDPYMALNYIIKY